MPESKNKNSKGAVGRENGISSMKLVQKQYLTRKHKARWGENLVYVIDIALVRRFAQKCVNVF